MVFIYSGQKEVDFLKLKKLLLRVDNVASSQAII